MNRWVLIFLLGLNVLYFGWTRINPPQTVSGSLAQPIKTGRVALHLASELNADAEPLPAEEVASDSQSSTVLGVPEQSARQGNSCIEIGPVEEKLEIDALADALNQVLLDQQVQQRASIEKTQYWVYVPPLASRAEAFQRLRDLRDIGIDSFVIESVEELRNGISLGIYSDENAALGEAAEFTDSGITAKVFSRPPDQPAYFLRGKLVADRESFTQILEIQPETAGENPKWYQVECEVIAGAEVID